MINGIQPFKKRFGTILLSQVTALEDAFRPVVNKGGPIDLPSAFSRIVR
jgi:hypothetical protein